MVIDHTYARHARATLKLGLPLMGSHMAQFAVNLSDAVMLGWYSVDALAAEVLGGTVWFVLFIVGSGFAAAVMPMVASAQASGQEAQVRRVTRMGMWVSLIFGFMVLPTMIWSEDLFLMLGQDADLSMLSADYLSIIGWSIFPALLVMVLKSYLSALERTQMVLWVTLGAVGLNVCINYLLIFGNWGFPELGVRGAAIASVCVATASCLTLAVYAAKVTPEHALFQRLWRPDWEAFGAVFRLGWPIGMTGLAESGLFAASSVMMGWLGTLQLAAHGIALQVTAMIFMVHVGLANAATVRAAQAFGRKDRQALVTGGIVVIGLSIIVALFTVATFLAVPEFLIGLFIHPDEPDRAGVIATGVLLLAAAALFQLLDAAQVMGLGLLRGAQDTKIPMVIAVLSYWAVGLPVSYFLGFSMGYGGVGVWLGLACGLGLAGVLMMTRFWGWTVRNL